MAPTQASGDTASRWIRTQQFNTSGSSTLPEIGAGLGKGIKSFKSGLREVEETGKNLVDENVPGAKEMNALKEEVDKAKDLGNVLKSKPKFQVWSENLRKGSARPVQ